MLAATAGVCFGFALVFIERGARNNMIMTLTGMRTLSVLVFLVAAIALRSIGGLVLRDAPGLIVVGSAMLEQTCCSRSPASAAC